MFKALGEPKIAKSHGGIIVEVSAESSPARAKQGSAVFSCATMPPNKQKGTKANREIFEFLERNCVEATAFGDAKRHVVSQDSKKSESFKKNPNHKNLNRKSIFGGGFDVESDGF